MAEKKRRRPADVAVRTVVKMPLGELTRFAIKLAKVDEEVARHLLVLLNGELPPPSTDAHGSGAAPFPHPPKPGVRGE